MRLAIIPARGGSKRIPRKNIKIFHGKPIIAYAIETALNSGLFDQVIVSTDDEEIAKIAMQHGASIPFMRSAKNSDDFASTSDVLLEILNDYQGKNIPISLACCLYPTSPLIDETDLINAYEVFSKNQFDTLFSAVNYSYPVQRSFFLGPKQEIELLHPEHIHARSQDLRAVYHDAGAFYFFKTEALRQQQTLWSKNSGAFLLPAIKVQDIDHEEDWIMAELKYQLIHGR